MTWFKVDDSFYDHPKVFDAPDSAVALWTRAGTWSARNLTDGYVPAKLPARLCDDPDTAVRELIDRGLWRRAKNGYQFHEWTEYQPTAASVKELRAKRAEAGRKGGEAKAAKQPPSNGLATASDFAKQNSAPARPDPALGSGGPEEVPHPARAETEPAPTCDRHPDGTNEPCRTCQRRREQHEQWQRDQTAARAEREQLRQQQPRCRCGAKHLPGETCDTTRSHP